MESPLLSACDLPTNLQRRQMCKGVFVCLLCMTMYVRRTDGTEPMNESGWLHAKHAFKLMNVSDRCRPDAGNNMARES